MRELRIDIKNKIATYNTRDGVIVCGNDDYKIKFTFDSEWDEFEYKTARFIWNDKYIDVVFFGDVVSVPMLSQTTFLTVGVFAGENLHTTTPAKIPCLLSVICESDRANEADYYEVNGTLEYRLPVIKPDDDAKILQAVNGKYELREAPDLTMNEEAVSAALETKVKPLQDTVNQITPLIVAGAIADAAKKLNTDAKTIIEAINELNGRMELIPVGYNEETGKLHKIVIFEGKVQLAEEINPGIALNKNVSLIDISLFDVDVDIESGGALIKFSADTLKKIWNLMPEDIRKDVENWVNDAVAHIGDWFWGDTPEEEREVENFGEIAEAKVKSVNQDIRERLEKLCTNLMGVAWELKDITKTVLPSKPIIHEFEFISNGIKFNRIRYYNYNAPAQDCYLAYRRSDDGEEITVYEYTQSNSLWQYDAYKTIITDDIDVSLEDIGAEINFELSIAERLGEKSKTVLGAIENLFDVEEIGNDIKGWLDGVADDASEFGGFIVDKIKSVGATLFGSKETVEQNTADIGDMSQLEIGGATTFNLRATPTKTTLVDAVNNVHYRTRALEEIPFLTATNNNLETTSKEIVGAINEINSTVCGIELGTHVVGKAQRLFNEEVWLETEAKTTLGAINEVNRKTLDKLAYMEGEAPDSVSIQDDGIRQGYKIRLANDDDGSFTEELVEVYNTIPIVAGENISFETSADRKTIKINATGGGSSTPSMIGTWTVVDEPEIPTGFALSFTSNGKTYTQILQATTGSSSWGIYQMRYQSADNDDGVYINNPSGSYGITHGWSDEAYKTITVTEEPTDPNAIAWLGANTNAPKVNTPKPCLEMPQIRFAGMPCDGWFGDIDFYLGEGMDDGIRNQCNLKFTIEIVGGGALQIGDTIQICRVKSYGASSSMWNGNTKFHPKKKKLRKYVEYIITEEDLDKRFITFEVQWNDKKARRLFGKTSTTMSGLSPLYFRIRRPKGDTFTNRDGKEYTSEAEFSNVVTVWKTCYPGAWLDPDTEEQIDYYKIKLV